MTSSRRVPLTYGDDDATVIPPGTSAHYILVTDADHELLADGIVPAGVQARCAATRAMLRQEYAMERADPLLRKGRG